MSLIPLLPPATQRRADTLLRAAKLGATLLITKGWLSIRETLIGKVIVFSDAPRYALAGSAGRFAGPNAVQRVCSRVGPVAQLVRAGDS